MSDQPNALDQIVNHLINESDGVIYDHDSDETYIQWEGKVIPIYSSEMRDLISIQYYNVLSKYPQETVIKNSKNILSSTARHKGKRENVYKRIKTLKNDQEQLEIHVNAGNGNYVQINDKGYQINNSSKVLFANSKGSLPLPLPQKTDQSFLELLCPLLNLESQSDTVLATAFILSSYFTNSPYPLLALVGQQGTGKTTNSKIIEKLIDPNVTPLRSMPKKEEDLAIMSLHSHLICFDNLSGMSAAVSDAICRVATGGGLSKRKLYEDKDLVTIKVGNPLITNGIGGFIEKPDLAERCILLHCPFVPPDQRKSDSKLWEDFEYIYPKLLDSLFNLISSVLRNLPNTKLDRLERMADYCLIGSAAEEALGLRPGDFMTIYGQKLRDTSMELVSSNCLARMIIQFALYHPNWSGSSTSLFRILKLDQEETQKKYRGNNLIPKAPNSLGKAVNRLSPTFKSFGIYFSQERSELGRKYRISLDFSHLPVDFDPYDHFSYNSIYPLLGNIKNLIDNLKKQMNRENYSEILKKIDEGTHKINQKDQESISIEERL